ncbi:hypothetical protein PC9H_004341 [Pleurotus ostreatus]|uniref:Uncharacterized protein n=1 Tax=Pleurotus ostreatus TaxID=5322 RepID=A0A8H7A023_PLEOS|nr:uncharacterized protein PC9H_004341 [Pleurotus ostreatus]KAF7437500.1 hypothetical protein PC9H_004341 [Pleurotus ostreatus]KAJ8703446.1 hypothetical protein PTI98_002067 [Pleurotus ostreatus]
MSSIASSASIKSGAFSTRSRRPPSPPSMYQCDFMQPKAPKPLPKIEKKVKTPKVKPEPIVKAKKADSPARGFATIWGVKGKRKVAKDVAPVLSTPPTFSTTSLPVLPPVQPSSSLSPTSHGLAEKPLPVPTDIASPPRPKPSTPSLGVSPQPKIIPSVASSPPSVPQKPIVLTPPSPDFRVLSDSDICARRIDKLTRTLGEQPPLDLVFPPFKRTYSANNQFPPPPEHMEPLFVGPLSSSQVPSNKPKDTDKLRIKTDLLRKNSLSVLSLPSTAMNKKVRRPSTATPPSPSSPSSFAPSSARPSTANPYSPSYSPTSTFFSARRPSTASASSSTFSRDPYTPHSPTHLSRDRVPFASHESLSSATTASSSSCYSVDTLNSSSHSGTMVGVHTGDDDHHIQGHPQPSPPLPSYMTVIVPEKTPRPPPLQTLFLRDEPKSAQEAELAEYEVGFAEYRPSPSPVEEDAPKLRTFTRAPAPTATARPSRRQPVVKAYVPSSRSRPSTAPASPLRSIRPSDMRPSTPFIDALVPMDEEAETQAPPVKLIRPSSRRERRQGWSGEWNRDDMQDVIKKLRNLK